MTVTARTLYETAQIPASDTTLYTAPVTTRTIIDKCTVTNNGAATATLTVNLVPSAGSVSGANVVKTVGIAPGTTDLCAEVVGHTLNTGDFISMRASAAGALTVRISGREVV